MTIGKVASHAFVFALAVLASAVAASIVQTQFNLAALTRMGAPVTLPLRVETTFHDLVFFGPIMVAIIAAAFLPAFLVAWSVGRVIPIGRIALFALAGAAGLWTAFQIMGFFTPMPTFIAAARGTAGVIALSLTGALGGALFGFWRTRTG